MSVLALNPLQPCSAIIFDCDGTLVDSTRLYFRAWNTLFKRHGAEMPWGLVCRPPRLLLASNL
jgi:phosphoglycolate phosphatase-like HAD superfamily hydrolase